MPIGHISDTARWVASYRAMETRRPDALFRDPYAERLAGPDGPAIVQALPSGRAMAWAMIVRTAVFDEIILTQVRQHGADLVLNLAAGLDARPWRLDLPPTLRWIDVDLPDLLDYKTTTLRSERPVCAYEACPADLTRPEALAALVARVGALAHRVLVVTEGLLIYLEPVQVANLARALAGPPSFRWWLIDLANPRLLAFLQRRWGHTLSKGNAPFRFAPGEGTAFFQPFGWHETAFRSSSEEAHRLGREMKFMWLWRWLVRFQSPKRREEFRRTAGYVLLGRHPGPAVPTGRAEAVSRDVSRS
jgi:methyltransferase (TIGR00027 family)